MKRLLVGTVLCLVLAAFPVEAADDDRGWFLGVEATYLRPSGGPANYAILDPDDSNFDVEGTIESIEIDEEIGQRVFLGYGSGNGNMWSLTWWGYDENALESVTAASPQELWNTVFDPGFLIFPFYGSADATLAVDATTIDLTYSRPLTNGDKFSTRWNVGLRSAEVEHMFGVIYDDLTDIYQVALASEGEGYGFTGGLTGTLMLNDRWMLHGGSSYSVLMGDFDTMIVSTFNGGIDHNVTGEREGGFSMLEARCMIVMHPIDWLYLWLGYEYQQWNNVLETSNFRDDLGFVLQTDISDLTFDGYTFGAGFKF